MKHALWTLTVPLLALSLFAQSEPGFGDNTETGALDSSIEDIIVVTEFTSDESCDIDTGYAYLHVTTAAKDGIFVIYADAGAGDAGALLGQSDTVNVGVGDAWVAFTFSTPVTVTTTDYFIGMAGDGGPGVFTLLYEAGATNQTAHSGITFPTLENPLTEDGTLPRQSFVWAQCEASSGFGSQTYYRSQQ